VRLYDLAKKLGFVIISITIHFEDDWNYEVEEKEFDPTDFYIDSPKRYDK
jgi:hypothetical protein